MKSFAHSAGIFTDLHGHRHQRDRPVARYGRGKHPDQAEGGAVRRHRHRLEGLFHCIVIKMWSN